VKSKAADTERLLQLVPVDEVCWWGWQISVVSVGRHMRATELCVRLRQAYSQRSALSVVRVF
jgi:hypothetical protein